MGVSGRESRADEASGWRVDCGGCGGDCHGAIGVVFGIYLLQIFVVLQCKVDASPSDGGVTASTGLLVAERHAGVWTPVIAHKTISAEPQFALAA